MHYCQLLNNFVFQGRLIEGEGLVGLVWVCWGFLLLLFCGFVLWFVFFFIGSRDGGGLVFCFFKENKVCILALGFSLYRCICRSSWDTTANIEMNWDFSTKEVIHVQGLGHSLFFQFSNKFFSLFF